MISYFSFVNQYGHIDDVHVLFCSGPTTLDPTGFPSNGPSYLPTDEVASNGGGDELSESTIMDVVILVVGILVALIIGVIVGLCIANKRKQSKQIGMVNDEGLNVNTKVAFEQLESEAENEETTR